MDGFDWIREIIPTKYFDNEEEIDKIIRRVRMELGWPMDEVLELDGEYTSELWEESHNMIETIVGVNFEETDVLKRWRVKYTILLCKEVICLHFRNYHHVMVDWGALLDSIRGDKQYMRDKLLAEYSPDIWIM